ncbi:hypothetical protein ABVT39_011520 [Epinephelus coioides]
MSVHFSVLLSSQKPLSQRCTHPACPLLHCPFCPLYKGDYAKVEMHLQSPLKTMVNYGDYDICNWGCRKGSHYHCYGCGITFPRRSNIIKHLSTCQPQPAERQQNTSLTLRRVGLQASQQNASLTRRRVQASQQNTILTPWKVHGNTG